MTIAETAEELMALGSATLGESGALRMDPRIKPAWAGAKVAGPAITAKCGKADNLAIHVAVAENIIVGTVLVVDASNPPELGYWGEVLTTAAGANDIAGLVIDGGCRDVDAIAELEFPVFSALVALTGAGKTKGGNFGKPVTVGGVEVVQGDWIVGDTDGVVVIPRKELDKVLEAGVARFEKEQQLFADLKAGQTTIELLGLDPSGLDKK
ncbi:MAG: 4-hydroxy-4-methyl-2-oxoglutarate aldolase [Actinomycetota bacterium]